MTLISSLLIYDGDCGFCQKTARLAQRWANGRFAIAPWQAIPNRLQSLGLTEEDGLRQVWFVDGNGRLTGGAEAVNEVLRWVWWAKPVALLYRLPGVHTLEDWGYRWVAANRTRLPGGTPTCALRPPAG